MSWKPEVHRVDANQQQIIVEMQLAGWKVTRIQRPLDLLVAKCGLNVLVECVGEAKLKRYPPNGLSPSQEKFIREWPGPIVVARNPLEAHEGLVARLNGLVDLLQGRTGK